jgi:hypothetical protein
MRTMLILAFTFFSWTGSPGRKFCIMLKHNGRESVILSESDIKYYDWDRQGICLTPEGIKQIKKVSVNLLTDTFFVRLGNTTLYEGIFEKAVSSNIGNSAPSILCDFSGSIVLAEKNMLLIWYFRKEKDLRRDDRLKRYLKGKQLLKPA